MRSETEVRVGDPLADHLRGAPWMDAIGRAAAGFTVVDRVVLPGAPDVLVVGPLHPSDHRYAVAVDAGDRPLPDGAPALADLDAAVVEAARAGCRVPTPGGAVVVHGDPPPYRAAVRFDSGWSTNAVSALDLGGVLHLHKRYRVLAADVHEPTVLAALHGTPGVPRYVARWAWVDPAGAERPVGVMYQHVAGEPLEDLLRVDLRMSLSSPPPAVGEVAPFDGTRGDPRPAPPLQGIAPVLRAAGAAIRELHSALAARIAPRRDYDVTGCLRRARALMTDVLARLRGDETLPAPVRHAVTAVLQGKVAALPARLAAWPPPRSTAGAGHGDLHLSHLLCRVRTAGTWDVSSIDLSPRVIDPGSPGFACQTPLQDLVAVHRGLQSFAGHEAAVQDASLVAGHHRTSSLAAVGDAARTGSATPPGSPERRRLFTAADAWSGRAFAAVLDGYGPDGLPPARHPLWQMLHTDRLLHELDYNLTRRRGHQVNLDLRHALAPDDVAW